MRNDIAHGFFGPDKGYDTLEFLGYDARNTDTRLYRAVTSGTFYTLEDESLIVFDYSDEDFWVNTFLHNGDSIYIGGLNRFVRAGTWWSHFGYEK